jgi:hypothetical protein
MSSVSTGACISSDAMFRAFSRTLSAATRVADAVITVAREARAPDAVLDAVGLAVNDAHLLHVGAEHFGGDLGHHGLKPWPIEAPPVMTSISPEVST